MHTHLQPYHTQKASTACCEGFSWNHRTISRGPRAIGSQLRIVNSFGRQTHTQCHAQSQAYFFWEHIACENHTNIQLHTHTRWAFAWEFRGFTMPRLGQWNRLQVLEKMRQSKDPRGLRVHFMLCKGEAFSKLLCEWFARFAARGGSNLLVKQTDR